jgi:hypothetical protein
VIVLGELVEGSFAVLLVVELERVGRAFLQIHTKGQEVFVFEVNFMLGIHKIAYKVPHLHHEPFNICDHGAELRLWEEFIGQVIKILERGDLLLCGDDELRLVVLGLLLGEFIKREVTCEDLGNEVGVLVGDDA